MTRGEKSLSAEQVAEKVGASPATVRKLFREYEEDRRAGIPPMQCRGIPCYRIGAQTRAHPRAIEIYKAGGYPIDVDLEVVREQVEATTRATVERMLAPVVERLAGEIVDEVDRHLKAVS